MPTNEAFKRIQANRGNAVQVTEDLYDYAKGCVPPIYSDAVHPSGDRIGMWAMGEPHSSTGDGTPTYYWFMDHASLYYAAYGTAGEAQKAFITMVDQWLTRNDPDELYKALCEIRDIAHFADLSSAVMRMLEVIDETAAKVTPGYVPVQYIRNKEGNIVPKRK